MTEKKSPLFDLLQADSDDIECLVAYALYKQHKRSWAASFEEQYGTKPTPDDTLRFAEAVSTSDQLRRYQQNAADLIISFANQVVEDERPEIEQEAITARIEAAASSVSGSASFGKQVLTGLVSSLITTFVLIVLTVAIALFGVDPLDGVSNLINPSGVQEPSTASNLGLLKLGEGEE